MSQHGDRGPRASAVAPLYQRLPRGPHRLGQAEVARHQRLRMHGAMVEAVAVSGYPQTSVKQIIGLAGVSRRAFYEQFANKEQCFVATFDLLAARGAQRIADAYRTAPGGVRERLQAGYEALATGVEANAKGALLTIVHAQTAGPAGLGRLRRASAMFEQMLCGSFAHAPDMAPMPIPVVRAIVGGVNEAISLRLRDDRAHEVSVLGSDLLDWTLLFQTPSLVRLSERLLERARLGASPSGWQGSARDGDDAGANSRERLLLSILHLAAVDDYHELSTPQIAEEAGVPIEIFLELFSSKEECFLAAFDALGDRLLQVAADPDLVSGEWPWAVRRVLGDLMGLLAARPLYAQTIARVAPAAGAQALARNMELAESIATLLTEGAPEDARNPLAREAVAGAIWHTVRYQVLSGQVHLLPALADYLAYVTLAPFIGADAAADLVIAELPEIPPGRG